MLFYVLNFSDHTFISFDFPELVKRHLNDLRKQSFDLDIIEVIYVDESSRMSAKEFLKSW